MDINLNIIMLGLTIVFFSSAVQGLVGFGSALIAVPLFTIFFSPEQAIPVFVIFGILNNTTVLIKARKYIRLKEIWILIVSGVIGIPFGTYILKIVNADILKIVIGIFIIIIAIALFKGYRAKFKSPVISSIFAGFFSGLLNGSLSMSGPPIVLFLSNKGVDKQVFRANLTAYLIIINIITFVSFIMAGIMNKQAFTYASIFAPGLFVGILVGIKFADKINERLFRKLVLIIIILTSLTTLITTLIKVF